MTPPVIKPLASGERLLTVSTGPHWRVGDGIRRLSLYGLLALLPAIVMAVSTYGMGAIRVFALSGSVCVLVEALCQKMMGRDIDVDNFNAFYMGVLFAFLLPAQTPWWTVVLGAALTASLGRMVFGGGGSSPLCAPLVAWAVCRISWPASLDIDLTMASNALNEPLAQLKFFGPEALMSQYSYTDLFLGHTLGSIGASQVAALLLGGIFLIGTRKIRWYIPVAFLVGVFATAELYHMLNPELYVLGLYHVLGGSVIFGAFFLATDTSSSPTGRTPQLLFGLIGGILVMIIRVYGMYPDGVTFAILLANLLSPLLDRIRPRPFGG
ncbi:RnfABCDGE type electron transport complex subunit D [Desulfobaculum bizertense]|uniref:Electron transport complex protein RnfD n=1 Tax=Desulfobaculum bizertense DSM 18034 TaxID=1121442 RepID=A0A1T4VU56_9BACT|nr:RnfABCDGE type electron transport complex subunit D [Desulfobaculum bizertense]SKA68449.1 electron transport complex protein RnfD [Desulfobaculum bizertense DSM 18034]